MSFEELKAKLAHFKMTGELDKVIMAKLASLLPVKQLIYKFLEDAAKSTIEFESDDEFLNWFNDLMNRFIEAEQKPPDRGTARIFIPAKKIGMSMAEADGVYRISLIGLVALIRSSPKPPVEKYEAERIRQRYGVEVV